mmetsp:Transcript_18385/g.63300  ORF Transcript_18385/g.63300 Transcript_18385/m.63300 type:complete len:241 (+) Transcript_18385:923-1645(+)
MSSRLPSAASRSPTCGPSSYTPSCSRCLRASSRRLAGSWRRRSSERTMSRTLIRSSRATAASRTASTASSSWRSSSTSTTRHLCASSKSSGARSIPWPSFSSPSTSRRSTTRSAPRSKRARKSPGSLRLTLHNTRLGRAWAEPFFSASALLEALAAVVEAVEAVSDAGVVGRHGGDHGLTLVVRERARRRLARRGSAHVLPELGEAVRGVLCLCDVQLFVDELEHRAQVVEGVALEREEV